MLSIREIRVLTLALFLVLIFTLPSLATAEYTFAYQTSPGEELEYSGELTNKVEVPWATAPDEEGATSYYIHTLQTGEDEQGLYRVGRHQLTLGNGENIEQSVKYRFQGSDFVYVEKPRGLPFSAEFFPPIPVGVGDQWTITARVPIPNLNVLVPAATEYRLEEVVPVGSDQVAVISFSVSFQTADISFMEKPVSVNFSGAGLIFWSVETGDYVANYGWNEIIIKSPELFADGAMVAKVTNREILTGGNDLPEPVEDYISLFLDYSAEM